MILAIKVGKFIDGTEAEPLRDAGILIEGEEIASVGKAGTVEIL